MLENKKYRDPYVILDYIKGKITDDGDYYIFLDEVQLLEEFEGVLNSLLHIRNSDIYVTGSNSKFLSKDIIERNYIEKVQEINDLINILASGIGSLTNASKIEATFKSVIGSDICLNTIRVYIEYFKDAFIISEANRFQVDVGVVIKRNRTKEGVQEKKLMSMIHLRRLLL